MSAARGKNEKEMYDEVDKLAAEDKKIKDEKRNLYTESEDMMKKLNRGNIRFSLNRSRR